MDEHTSPALHHLNDQLARAEALRNIGWSAGARVATTDEHGELTGWLTGHGERHYWEVRLDTGEYRYVRRAELRLETP